MSVGYLLSLGFLVCDVFFCFLSFSNTVLLICQALQPKSNLLRNCQIVKAQENNEM